jgi:uncharacterized protein YecT (DUF1311 family)
VVDYGDPFIGRGRKLYERAKTSLDYDVLLSLGGREITIGQIIAHIIPISSMNDISSCFSELFECDFVQDIASIHDRRQVEIMKKDKTPILGDASLVWTLGNEIFKFRHILAHERPREEIVNQSRAIEYADFAHLFLKASWEFFTNRLEPNYPLTQMDMNEKAWQSAESADNHMQELVVQIENILCDNPRALKLFQDAQRKWAAFRDANVIFRWDPEGLGTLGPTIRGLEYESLTKDRIKFLEWWFNREEGEM